MVVLKLTLLLLGLVGSAFGYFWVAERFGIVDRPNERSSHRRVTLRGGGVVFVVGVVLYYLLFGFVYSWFFGGLLAIALVSFLDDIWGVLRASSGGSSGVPSGVRILVHFGAILMMFADAGFYSLPWYWFIVAFIVGTGVINAYNFMDGINGITGGYSLVVVASLWVVNRFGSGLDSLLYGGPAGGYGSFSWTGGFVGFDGTYDKALRAMGVGFVDENLLFALALALLVFNFFNFRHKARCFAGDVGSVSIAFIVVFLIGRLMVATGNFAWIALLLVYGVDSVLTIVYRLMLRENIFEAHRKHLYQLLANEHGLPHVMVSIIYMAVQAAASLIFIFSPTWWTFLALAIPLGTTWLLLRISLTRP